MNKKIFEKWIKALRSGSYIKVRGALRNDVGFCALGVLCDISGVGTWETEPNSKKLQYLGQIHYLPKQVAEWAGMSPSEASKVSAFLLVHNDNLKIGFNDLASLLEQKYKKKKVEPHESMHSILPNG